MKPNRKIVAAAIAGGVVYLLTRVLDVTPDDQLNQLITLAAAVLAGYIVPERESI